MKTSITQRRYIVNAKNRESGNEKTAGWRGASFILSCRLDIYEILLYSADQILHGVKTSGLLLKEQGGVDSALGEDFFGHSGMG